MHLHRPFAASVPLRRSFFRFPVATAFCALTSLSAGAMAAGIDCAVATSDAEKQICAREPLRRMDAQVAERYTAALEAAGPDAPSVEFSQRQWLLQRDACRSDVECLEHHHTERIQELDNLPDQVDMRAARELKRAIEERRVTHPEFALDQALASVALGPKNGLTSFAGGADTDVLPKRRPPGVSRDEWAALKKAHYSVEAEPGGLRYLLIDIDGRGRRDLAVHAYVGGTGLWEYTYFLRREGDRFVCAPGCKDYDESNLYSVNGRGAAQDGQWVRLQGRVYLAFFNGAYGIDNVYLLRPGKLNRVVAHLAVRYRYRFSVAPDASKSTRVDLTPEQKAQLQQTLDGVEPGAGSVGCPAPAGADESTIADYGAFNPGHYTVEIAGNFPVWFGEQCRLGQLIDWFGSYGKDGLYASLSLRTPGGASDSEEEFDVTARRRIERIFIDMAARP